MDTFAQHQAALPVTLSDALVPLDENGTYVPNHLDNGGTVHWFSVVDAPENENKGGEAYQLRYYRAVRDERGQIVQDSHPVMPLADRTTSPFPLPALQVMLEEGELEKAQELAYHTAETYGVSFPEPVALPILPVSQQQSEAAFIAQSGELDTQPLEAVTVAPDPAVERFRAEFADSAFRLLEPIHPVVNYSFETLAVDPYTLELSADKWWHDEQGQLVYAVQPINTYSLESYEFEREIERERGAMDAGELRRTYQEEGLEAAMRKAESMAVANSQLDPNRPDGRLFPDGPPDRFVSLRRAELAGLDAQPLLETERDITNDETQEIPAIAPAPGSWDELLLRENPEEPEPERHYWQIQYRPVETPGGERLGTALFVMEFPQLPSDFDKYLDEYGMDDSIYPTEARALELAHFQNDEDARKFEAEFRGYLVPDVMDGPELAPEVAQLEGLSGICEDIDYQGIMDYMSGNRTIVREAADWHLHNPNAERDVRIEAPEQYTEASNQFMLLDRDKNTSDTEPSVLDFDL